jgi:hypothetical protein
MRWVHIHNVFLSGTDFWWYLDKAYNSVPGSGGSNPLHAIPCVDGLTSLVLMFKATICHLSTYSCYAIGNTLFPSLWRSAGPAGVFAGHQLSPHTSPVSRHGPLVGPARPTCKHLFPSPTICGLPTKSHKRRTCIKRSVPR